MSTGGANKVYGQDISAIRHEAVVNDNIGKNRSMSEFDKSKTVPIDTTSTENNKETAEHLKKIHDTLKEIKESNNQTQTAANTTQSGYDAYNVRDPLLASLNSGTLDLA